MHDYVKEGVADGPMKKNTTPIIEGWMFSPTKCYNLNGAFYIKLGL